MKVFQLILSFVWLVQSFNFHTFRRHSLLNVQTSLIPSSSLSPSPQHSLTLLQASLSSTVTSSEPATILLVGPSFLQLNIAKLLKSQGHHPIVVAPQKQLDKFKDYIDDEDLCSDEHLSIGLPDLKGDPLYDKRFYGGRDFVDGVIFTAEDALLSGAVLKSVLGFEGYGPDGPRRAVAAIPLTQFVKKEKSMGWMPILNNDQKEKQMWDDFTKEWRRQESSDIGDRFTTVRVGSLLGGGVDGPAENKLTGLNEEVYKMSLEQYRDLKERAFDRYRCGVQILQGDAVNQKPDGQSKLEEKALKGEELEAFRASGAYPEQDRTNRHTAAYAIVEAYFRSNRGDFAVDAAGTTPKEFTVLSKATPISDCAEWDAAFASPGPAAWPMPP